jgi:TonB family protein
MKMVLQLPLASLLWILWILAPVQRSSAPKILSFVSPAIPYIAFYSRASGPVVVEAHINSQGVVANARILQGHPLLRNSTREALLQWRFQPDSETQDRAIRLTFNYQAFDYQETDHPRTTIPVTVFPYDVELKVEIPSRPAPSSVRNEIPSGWEPGRDRCNVHNTILRKDRVKIRYGLMLFDKEYAKVTEQYFPNANLNFEGGCVLQTVVDIDPYSHKRTSMTEQEADVLYCSRCRQAEHTWKSRHKNR